MAQILTYRGAVPKGGSDFYVMIATPIGSRPAADYVRTIAAIVETFSRSERIRFDLCLIQGHCHVDDVRNTLIRDFLQQQDPPYTDLFFIDDDIGSKGRDAHRLLKVPGDIVAGVYPHKSDDKTFPFHPQPGLSDYANEYGLIEMPKVATGFMRVRRPVLEALYEREKARGRLSRPGDELANDARLNMLPVARIVERGFPSELGLRHLTLNDGYTSGDYVLCLKARDAGFKVLLDPDIGFTHTGEKIWRGHFGNMMRQKQGQYTPGFIQAVKELQECRKQGRYIPKAELFARLHEEFGYEDWPLIPQALKNIYLSALCGKTDIIETGAGLSTLVMGIALAGTDRMVHAIEHDVCYFNATSRMLDDFGAPNVVMHYAPFEPLNGGSIRYAIETLPKVDFALIDGPPHRFGRLEPVRHLWECIKDADLVIDDAMRESELVEFLREHGHHVELQFGDRWWATSCPESPAVEEAAE
jgi:predicted O-methyltransferase YrrM